MPTEVNQDGKCLDQRFPLPDDNSSPVRTSLLPRSLPNRILPSFSRSPRPGIKNPTRHKSDRNNKILPPIHLEGLYLPASTANGNQKSSSFLSLQPDTHFLSNLSTIKARHPNDQTRMPQDRVSIPREVQICLVRWTQYERGFTKRMDELLRDLELAQFGAPRIATAAKGAKSAGAGTGTDAGTSTATAADKSDASGGDKAKEGGSS